MQARRSTADPSPRKKYKSPDKKAANDYSMQQTQNSTAFVSTNDS